MLVFPNTQLQTEDWDCGRAAARAVLSLFGRTTIGGFQYGLDLVNPVQGLCPGTMEAALRAYGLPLLSGLMRVEDLKHFTQSGRPVLCPIKDDGGHWVAVAGVHRGYVHYFDPTLGMTKRKSPDWIYSWRDSDSKGNVYAHWGICVG